MISATVKHCYITYVPMSPLFVKCLEMSMSLDWVFHLWLLHKDIHCKVRKGGRFDGEGGDRERGTEGTIFFSQ